MKSIITLLIYHRNALAPIVKRVVKNPQKQNKIKITQTKFCFLKRNLTFETKHCVFNAVECTKYDLFFLIGFWICEVLIYFI